MSSINWNMIEAMATLLGSIVATIGVWLSARMVTKQLRIQQLTVAIDRLSEHRRTFLSETNIIRRNNAATILKRDVVIAIDSRPFDTEYSDVDQILDFLEVISFEWSSELYSTEMLWNEFHGVLTGYYQATTAFRSYIRESRRDPTIWENFDIAAEEVEQFQRTQLTNRYPASEYQGLNTLGFLDTEMALR